jgi:hypothetical protein|tara:strand:+ start:341 stop:574 length:234 start_codon:yes stop_codon:yes gene_type:complete
MMRSYTIEGIVKMYEELIDRQKEMKLEKMHLHSVLHEHLISMEDGERVRIRGTYFNRDYKKQVGGTIRYTIPYEGSR